MAAKIDYATFIKLSNNHIPYFEYLKVSGPRSGVYILDEFNTERLLWELASRDTGIDINYIREIRLEKLLRILGVEFYFSNNERSEEQRKKHFKKLGITYLERLDGEKTRKKIISWISLSDAQIKKLKEAFKPDVE